MCVCMCVHVCTCVSACIGRKDLKNSSVFWGASDTYYMNPEGFFSPRCSDTLPKRAKTKSLGEYELA